MNKYQEAKKWIDKVNAHPEWARCDFEEPALSQLTELVEKATPKKPMYKEFDDNGEGEIIPTEAYCPTCGNEFKFGEFNDIVNHHCVCGQALDWSKEDER